MCAKSQARRWIVLRGAAQGADIYPLGPPAAAQSVRAIHAQHMELTVLEEHKRFPRGECHNRKGCGHLKIINAPQYGGTTYVNNHAFSFGVIMALG